MATYTLRSKPHADIVLRLFDLPGHGVTAALAEGILALDSPEGEAVRVKQLNARANECVLTDEEQTELEAYINIGDLLAYWQSKARQATKSQA